MVASIRPRLELVVHLSVEQVMRSVRLRLKSPDCPVSGLVAEHRLEVHAHAKDQHLWSPQLIVDLEPLGDLPELSGLNLSSTSISDAGLIHLERCHELRIVDLRKTNVTAAGVETLQQALPRCLITWDDPVTASSTEHNVLDDEAKDE